MHVLDNRYYVTRGQKIYTDGIRTRKEIRGYRHILTIECTPNARYLLQSIVDNTTIKRSVNYLTIHGITEIDLITKINTIYEERKNIII
jgi:hypothetical protein